MKSSDVLIEWPNGNRTYVKKGADWLQIAIEAGIDIPTGCLGGSCGACEIEVNGKVIRACISRISSQGAKPIKVDLVVDPYW